MFKERIKIVSTQRHGIRKCLENPKSAIKKQAVKSDMSLAGCRRQYKQNINIQINRQQ